MDKKEYFKNLLLLFEENIGMAGTEEVVPQENIADTGSDVNPGMNPDEQIPNEGEAAELPYGMTDELPASEESVSDIVNKQKLLKLYNLYEDLLNYCTIFLDSLGNIDTNLLDIEVFKLVRKYTISTKELADKINTYMTKIYSSDSYERLLYIYILFRTELTTCIKGIRDILRLNNLDEKIDKK